VHHAFTDKWMKSERMETVLKICSLALQKDVMYICSIDL
jgi:hypothetical protein